MADIPIELLWRAWPEGYLAKRGVSAREGWTCVHTTEHAGVFRQHNDPHEACVQRSGDNDSLTSALLRQGELLPNVDPTDTATWACLLADLAEAVNARMQRENKPPTHKLHPTSGLIFHYATGNHYWSLTDGRAYQNTWAFQHESPEPVRQGSAVFLPATPDPALALVWCRIYERERA